MAALSTALRQETAFIGAQPQRNLSPAWASQSSGAAGGLYTFTLQSVGGVVFVQDAVPRSGPSERGIHWQIENSATGALHLTEFTIHGGASGPRTTVEVGFQLFPALAATSTPDGRLVLAALLSNGYLLHTELREPAPGAGAASSGSEALLAGLSAASFRPLDISAQLVPLGGPTSLAATADAVVVGGTNGSVLCVPLATLEDGNVSRCFELRDSSWALTKLIPGMLYRPRQPAALACVPVTLGSSAGSGAQHQHHQQHQQQQLLLVAYDDGVLRAFNVGRRQQMAALELETPGAAHATAGGAARAMVPTYVAAEAAAVSAPAAGGGAAGAATLVVQFEAADTLKRHTYAYTLAAGGAGGGGRLALSGAVELAVEEGGVVAEARVSGETVWLLLRNGGRSKVLGYSRASGAVVSAAVLAESAGEHVGGGGASCGGGSGAGGGGNGTEVDTELWEWLLAAFPSDLTAEGQVCHSVLVPGQICRSSLRDALSYHGAQLSAAEVEAAPYGVLRGWMQAAVLAIQRRTPTASGPECWQSFLSTYRAAWARRHPPLGMVLHRSSPDWLGLARGGSVLAVLRRGTGVEALVAAGGGGEAAAGPGGEVLQLPPHLDAVHSCAVEAGALLGPLAQEACLSLLVSGVDPLEQLVPRLCELWMGGPSTLAAGAGAGAGSSSSSSSSSMGGAPPGAFGRAAALTDSAREAQQRWRQRRQLAILRMGQRLGALGNPVAAVQSYLALLRLLNTQAAAELSAAAAGHPSSSSSAAAPSRAAASFLVATCRQLSRAVAAAARDMALLLGLIRAQGALGAAAALDRASLGRLEGPLLAEACGLLRRAALGLWLTGTPSTQDEGTDMEPALSALRHLRLGGSPTAAAKRSHADGPGAPPAAASASTSTTSSEVSLAARLLPAFCAAYAGGGAAAAAAASGGPRKQQPPQQRRLDLLTGAESSGLLFTMYLQYGDAPAASMAGRVLQLGYQLFQAGEYGNLAELAALAGATGAAEAGPQFLRGLGITCALALERQQAATQRVMLGSAATAGATAGGGGAPAHGHGHHGGHGGPGPSSGARRAELIAEAAGCFFRAAASLASEAGDTLRTILKNLRSELAGGGGGGGGAAADTVAPAAAGAGGAGGAAPVAAAAQGRREVALLQLHFCEAVMQLFEREGAPEGAVVFAAAALEHLRNAYGPANGPASDAAAAGGAGGAADLVVLPGEEPLLQAAAAAAAAERASREGRLWSNIYSYCVEMRQYDRAYAALLANPLPAARLQSLRHLVHMLAQDRQLQVLCTLPFAGVAVLPLAPTSDSSTTATAATATRAVSLLSEALDLLHRRAHNCDLAESPQPYQVLYDFLVCRGDYKGAARAMAAYAWRLRAEAPAGSAEAVAEALHAYDMAINCLSLLDPEDAWLDLTDPWIEKLAPACYSHVSSGSSTHATLAPAPRSGALAAGAANGSAGPMDLAGRSKSASDNATSAAAAAAAPAPVATVASLQRERTMLHYCALVAARVAGLEPMRQWDNEDAILRQLLLLGRYEGGLALVADCCGPRGGEAWGRAMEAVVGALAAHCMRLQLQDGGVPTGGPALPTTDLFTDDPDGGAAAAGLGAAGAAAVAGTLGGRAAPLWAKLRSLLAAASAADVAAEAAGGAGGGGGLRVAWMLRDAAAEAVLRVDPRVDLPQWLLDMFLSEELGPEAVASGDGTTAAAAMGAAACGPASLLSLYLRHDRLAAAVDVVAAAVEAWGRVDVRLRRRHSAAWMPYPQLELLHTKVVIAQQLGQERSGALLGRLNAALAEHLDLVATDTERLQDQLASAAGRDAAAGTGAAGAGMGNGHGFGMGLGMDASAPPLLLLGGGGTAAPSPLTPMMGGGAGGGAPLFGAGLGGGGVRLFG